MSKWIIDSSTLTDIADAVREKTGSQESIQVDEIAGEIENIPTGGSGIEGIQIYPIPECGTLGTPDNGVISYYDRLNNAEDHPYQGGINGTVKIIGNMIEMDIIGDCSDLFVEPTDVAGISFAVDKKFHVPQPYISEDRIFSTSDGRSLGFPYFMVADTQRIYPGHTMADACPMDSVMSTIAWSQHSYSIYFKDALSPTNGGILKIHAKFPYDNPNGFGDDSTFIQSGQRAVTLKDGNGNLIDMKTAQISYTRIGNHVTVFGEFCQSVGGEYIGECYIQEFPTFQGKRPAWWYMGSGNYITGAVCLKDTLDCYYMVNDCRDENSQINRLINYRGVTGTTLFAIWEYDLMPEWSEM